MWGCLLPTQAESYIMGMLTNLESLPLARIHNMLKVKLAQRDDPML